MDSVEVTLTMSTEEPTPPPTETNILPLIGLLALLGVGIVLIGGKK